MALALTLAAPLALPELASASAQARPPQLCPEGSCQPPVLREHASGGEVPVAVGGVALLGLMIYDIATAPSAARADNLERMREEKSPSRALALSLGATAVPLAAGAFAIDRGVSGGSAATGVGFGLVFAGVALGPSAGHWYAGRRQRALRNAGIRGALLLGVAVLESCCT